MNKKMRPAMTMLAFIGIEAGHLRAINRIGTAQNYESACKSLKRYIGTYDKTDISFAEVTPTLLLNYQEWLWRSGMTRNSSSCYMRCLRAAYNKARQCLGTAFRTKEAEPFKYVYTGRAKTLKRAIDTSDMRLLMNLDIRQALMKQGCDYGRRDFKKRVERLETTRDYFIFCFCSRGLTFVDLAHLRSSNIHDGVISYRRRKTGQEITVKIEPQMQEIIDRHRNKASNDEYLFPIIKSKEHGGTEKNIRTDSIHNNSALQYQEYRKALGAYNRDLHIIEGMIGGHVRLTSYVSRHSWATSAYHNNVPIGIISKAMGHTSEITTQIYLQSFSDNAIDRANHTLLQNLFYEQEQTQED